MAVAKVEPGKTRLGWIGTGVMGASMCGHLIDKGFAMTVFNRTRAKTEALVAKGAEWADSPKAVAEASDVVFTIVGYPDDVRRVTLDDDGTLAGCKSGDILVDMTTSEPKLAEEIAEAAAKQRGVYSIDAPVSGGDVGAREARLSIMIGGEREAVDALAPCWEAMGKTIVYQGGPGAGQHTKMVEPDPDRHEDDRRLRIAALRLPRRARLEHGHAIGHAGRGRQLVSGEPGPADHRQQLRSRLLTSNTSSRTWASR